MGGGLAPDQLFTSEVAIGVLCWVVAYELALARERPLVRLRAAAPLLAIGAVYVVLYKLAGFGTHGSGWYLDPFDEPARFFTEALPLRLPRLLQGLLTPLPAEIGVLFDAPALALAGLALTALMIGLLADDGTVREIDVEIGRPLDDPEVWLLAWDGERLSRFRPPAVGEMVVLGDREARSASSP